MSRPKLLIEDWLPVQAIGVECMRERSTGQQPPDKRLHVWWARRPLSVSRAAVLGSLLPGDFDRECFERLLGFYAPSEVILRNQQAIDSVASSGRTRIANPHSGRAFSNSIPPQDLQRANEAFARLWGGPPVALDSMAGGGSIPLEASRLGVRALANELNPVACSILEATVRYPFHFGRTLSDEVRAWAEVWRKRFVERAGAFYETDGIAPAYTYIFAHTVPCPETGHPTPLVPDWSLLHPKGGLHIVAEPVVTNREVGKWTVRVREIGKGAGQLRQPPLPTYADGKAVSVFSDHFAKPGSSNGYIHLSKDYIKANAQQARMGSALYAVATKATSKLAFRPAEEADLHALEKAERELARLRPEWERDGVIPTEEYPEVSTDPRPRVYGMPRWADMFSPRQLLALGVLVGELRRLRPEIIAAQGEEVGEAVLHLLALVVDKFANYSSILSSWKTDQQGVRSVFDRHDYAFKATWAEMSPCFPAAGLAWAVESVLEAYENLAQLPRSESARPVTITQGSATNLLEIEDKSITAVVVDPPYADNVQYSELADFFYVWLKRTQEHRRPEWFSTYLCDKDEEAVVNTPRHRGTGDLSASEARAKANEFYQRLMTDSFHEANRVLRDDGVLTVMFTHKKQEAWAALFESLIAAGFTITATWPVQTESQHSLHQAQKNAAQSTVILVARKREGGGRHYYDEGMRQTIRQAARDAAARLKREGLNAVDQLVGAFGPAMEVFSRYEEVRTDTGQRVAVADAIQVAADAVAEWRVEQLASRGLEGVDPDSRFYLLCWDVLGAAEFRFNEASMLGKAVGTDVSRLKDTGLVVSSGEKVKMLPATVRRREQEVKSETELTLFGAVEKRSRRAARKVHPSDEYFVSAVDMCHALVLRYLESGGGDNGIGAARGMALQMGWGSDSACAALMTALVNAAPSAVQFPGRGKKKTAADEFPEFRAWRDMLKPLFGIEPPEWKEPVVPQTSLSLDEEEDEEEESEAE